MRELSYKLEAIKTLTLLVLLLIFTNKAFAFGEEKEEINNSIYFGGFSKHLFTDGLNETHHFLGYERNDILIGAFKNSYNDWTAVAAYDFDYNFGDYFDNDFAKQIDFGVMLGASYGYECEMIEPMPCYNKISPVVLPYVSYTYQDFPIKPVLSLLGEAVFVTFRVDY